MDKPRFILLSAFWFGLLTGLCEAVILLTQQLAFHQTILLSEDVYWMAPVADAIIFAAPGIILSLAAMFWPNFVPDRIIVFTFAFMGFVSLLLLFPLSKSSTGILAGGLAVVTSQISIARQEVFSRLMRRSSVFMVVLVFILFVGISVVYS